MLPAGRRRDAGHDAQVKDLASLSIGPRPAGVRLSVHVKPRASRTQIVGVRDGALEVAVAAPPVEGEANAALVRALSDALGVAARDIAIASGHSGKRKIVDIAGLSAAALRARLAR
jgi:hypothetical protein